LVCTRRKPARPALVRRASFDELSPRIEGPIPHGTVASPTRLPGPSRGPLLMRFLRRSTHEKGCRVRRVTADVVPQTTGAAGAEPGPGTPIPYAHFSNSGPMFPLTSNHQEHARPTQFRSRRGGAEREECATNRLTFPEFDSSVFDRDVMRYGTRLGFEWRVI
jgi:hypothetical protein